MTIVPSSLENIFFLNLWIMEGKYYVAALTTNILAFSVSDSRSTENVCQDSIILWYTKMKINARILILTHTAAVQLFISIIRIKVNKLEWQFWMR